MHQPLLNVITLHESEHADLFASVNLDATQAAAAIRRGELKFEDLVRAGLTRIGSLDSRLRAFRDLVAEDEVLAQARNLDGRKVRQLGKAAT